MLHKSLAVEYNQKGMDNFSFIKGENSYFNSLSINSVLSKYSVLLTNGEDKEIPANRKFEKRRQFSTPPSRCLLLFAGAPIVTV